MLQFWLICLAIAVYLGVIIGLSFLSKWAVVGFIVAIVFVGGSILFWDSEGL